MKNNSSEKPERNNSEEGRTFSGRDLGDVPRGGNEHSKGGERPTDVYTSPQVFGSLRRQKQSQRSQRLLLLLCIGLGAVVLGIFFLMKPGAPDSQIAEQQMTHPISPLKEEERPTIPGTPGKKTTEQESSEGTILEGEKPTVANPPEAPLVNDGSRVEKDVGIAGDTEPPEGEKDGRAAEVVQGAGETKAQVAKAAEPDVQATPEQKPLVRRFTINVGSFKERGRAETLMNELKEEGYEAFVTEATIAESGTFYRVSVGRFPSWEEADALGQELKEKWGIDSFVRELKEEKS